MVRRRSDQQFIAWVGRPIVQPLEQTGVEPAGRNVIVGQYESQEVDIGSDSENGCLGQCAVQAAQSRAAVGAVSDDLCQHRVVVAADRHSGGETGIHPDARSARLEDRQHRPPSGQKAGRRVLGVHPGLDRVAVHHDVVLTGRQPLPRSDAYLPLH